MKPGLAEVHTLLFFYEITQQVRRFRLVLIAYRSLEGYGDTLHIPLVMYERSKKKDLYASKNPGKCIKKVQVLTDGAATVGGELALGTNVLVAYMPWAGYNLEDGVLISERLVYEDIVTSFHIRKYEIQTHVTSQGPERITNDAFRSPKI